MNPLTFFLFISLNKLIEKTNAATVLLDRLGVEYDGSNETIIDTIPICDDMEISFDITIGDWIRTRSYRYPFWIGSWDRPRYGVLIIGETWGYAFEYETVDDRLWPYTALPDSEAIYRGELPQDGRTYSIKLTVKNSDSTYKFYIDNNLVIDLVKPYTETPEQEQPVTVGINDMGNNGGISNHRISNILITCLSELCACKPSSPASAIKSETIKMIESDYLLKSELSQIKSTNNILWIILILWTIIIIICINIICYLCKNKNQYVAQYKHNDSGYSS